MGFRGGHVLGIAFGMIKTPRAFFLVRSLMSPESTRRQARRRGYTISTEP